MKKEEKKRRKLLLNQRLHPNECFCKWDEQDWSKDTFLRVEKQQVWWPYPRNEYYDVNIYKCGQCGKERTHQPAMA